MPNDKTRNWCFTLNNYTEGNIEGFEGLVSSNYATYVCFGREVAPTTLTPHLQGYICLKNAGRISGLRQAFISHVGDNATGTHFESARGNHDQCITYCSKEGQERFTEIGNRPRMIQGKRTDLHDVADAVKNGSTMNDIAESHPVAFIKFTRGIQAMISSLSKRRTWKTEVVWCSGPTASGKSRFAWATAPAAYSKACENKWWCGYTGEEDVILDDFRPTKEMSFAYILRLFDQYPMKVESKGGSIEFLAKRIFVTTTKTPEEFCQGMEWLGEEDVAQLLRRIERKITFPQMGSILSTTP